MTDSAAGPGQGVHAPDKRNRSLAGGALYYTIVCLTAAALVVLGLQDRGLESWSFLPLAIGLIGALTRWSLAPLALLFFVGGCLCLETRAGAGWLRVPDFVLCSAALAYVAAHYRLQGLGKSIFPVNERERRRTGPLGNSPRAPARGQATRPAVDSAGADWQRRSAQMVSPGEVGLLILTMPLWAGLAQLAWNLLPARWGDSEVLPVQLWRIILLVWSAGLVLLVTAGALDYWHRRAMTPAEARLFLQDFLWQETRGEQRLIQRWFVWARLGKRGWFYTLVALLVVVLAFFYIFYRLGS